MTNTPFDIDDLIIRFLTGETTPRENQFLSDWMNESDQNLSYFHSIRNIWLATSQLSPVTASRNITLHPESESKEDTSSRGNRIGNLQKNTLNQLLKIAAILAVVMITGVVVYNQFTKKTGSGNSIEIAVEATLGSRAITTLPDGSKVWLNSGSKLVYNSEFNGETREVKLIGEAYFNVVTNPSKPFVVKTDKLNIKALGTKFNVKAYPEDASIVTTLEKGNVVIEGKDSRDKEFIVQMKPKETVTYYKSDNAIRAFQEDKTISNDNKDEKHIEQSEENDTPQLVTKKEQVKTELFTSWKDARWVIEKQKLGDLERDLERRYNIEIQFTSETIRQFHFTGSLENETVEQIMVIMRHTIPLKYKIEKGIVSIGEDSELLRKFYK